MCAFRPLPVFSLLPPAIQGLFAKGLLPARTELQMAPSDGGLQNLLGARPGMQVVHPAAGAGPGAHVVHCLLVSGASHLGRVWQAS